MTKPLFPVKPVPMRAQRRIEAGLSCGRKMFCQSCGEYRDEECGAEDCFEPKPEDDPSPICRCETCPRQGPWTCIGGEYD